jgi:hypothetical protein
MHDRFDHHARIHVQPAHQAIEFGKRTFGMDPAFRRDLPFQHNLGIGDGRHRYRFTFRQAQRLAAQTATETQFIDAKIGFERRRHQLERMCADRNRNRQRLFFRQGALGEFTHVIWCDNIDAGDVSLLQHEPVDPGIDAELRIFRNHHARRNHWTAVHHGKNRHRQIIKIDIFTSTNDVFDRSLVDRLGRDRMVERVAQLVGDLLVRHAHTERNPIARLHQAGNYRNGITLNGFKEKRLLRLRDQRGNIAQVDGLRNFKQLVVSS